MKLRNYQSDIIDYVQASVMFGSTRICVEAPTGSGKSLLISELTKVYSDDKIIILVNVSKLIGQISDHLTAVGVDHSILKAGMETSYDETKRVQLWMEQTYDARKDKITCDADVLIRDEHHIGFTGDRFNNILVSAHPNLVIGFSATPYDKYGVALPGYETASFVDIKKLTDQGFLMKANTYITPFGQKINLGSIGKSADDYTEAELDDLLNREQYNLDVANEYIRYHGRKCIVFVSGTQHAEDLAEVMKKRGIQASFLHSKMSKKDQADTMDAFKGKAVFQIDVLVSVSMLTTGFDMPECSMVINCRPTKVRSLYVQMIGRVLRLSGDPTETAVIVDCCRATTEHGLYDEPFTIHHNKLDAKAERKRRSEPIIDYLAAKYPGEIKGIKEEFNMGLNQVKNDPTTEGMVWRFENADDTRELLHCACDLYRKFYKKDTDAKTIKWIMPKLEAGVKRFGISPFRTRLRNIIKDGKKIAGIYYFGDWLAEQQNY